LLLLPQCCGRNGITAQQGAMLLLLLSLSLWLLLLLLLLLPQLRSAAAVSMTPERCQPGLLQPKQLHTTHCGSSAFVNRAQMHDKNREVSMFQQLRNAVSAAAKAAPHHPLGVPCTPQHHSRAQYRTQNKVSMHAQQS
jgi:hypothetical protein